MHELIEALTILSKYFNEDSWHSKYPTHCEHDVLLVFPDREVSAEDTARLDELGFCNGDHEAAAGEDCFYSYRYGSC